MNNQHNDLVTKFHFLSHAKKCKFSHITFDTNLNTLINNNKLLSPLYYTHMNIIGQKPKIKISEKSNASFKLRPNMPIGTHTRVQAKSYLFNILLKNLVYAWLPGIKRQANKELISNFTLWAQNSSKSQISYPIENLNFLYSFFYLPPLSVELGGANIAITCEYKHKHFYLPIHSFFMSNHYLYWN